MPDDLDVSTADSSAAPATAQSGSADLTSTATTQPTQGAEAKEPPFHTHPRWQQMMSHNRGLTSQVAQLTQELQALKQAQQQAPNGQMTPQQRFEFQQAGEALENLMRQHPRMARLLDLAEKSQQLLQSSDQVASLSKAQFTALTRQGRGMLSEMFKGDNLPAEAAQDLEDLIAAKIRMNPERLQRYMTGDIDVVREVYSELKPFVDALRRTATTSTIEAKGRVAKLPPRPVGGGPGQPALPKLEAGKEREYSASLRKMAAQMLGRG